MNKKNIIFIKSLLVLLALSFLFLPIIYTTLSTLPEVPPSDYSWMSVSYISLNASNRTITNYVSIVFDFALPFIMMALILGRIIFGDKIKIPYLVVLALCLIFFIYTTINFRELLFLIPIAIFAADIIYEIVQIVLIKRSKK